MRVRDLLRKKQSEPITIRPHDTVATAAHVLMTRDIGALPVVDAAGAPIGLLSERDIVRAVARHAFSLHSLTVERSMRRPPPVCSANDSLHEVMIRMTRDRLRHLIVMDNDRMADVISVGDLVKDCTDELETEAGVLRDYVAGQRAVIVPPDQKS